MVFRLPSPFAAFGGSSLSRWEREGAAQPRKGEGSMRHWELI
jgi:hypothetical protein